jgi:GTP-binding protein
MDIRREWEEEEEQIEDFCRQVERPFLIVLTKADKISRGQQSSKRLQLKKKTGADEVFVVSNLKKTGHKDIEKYIFDHWMTSEEAPA